MIEDAEDVEGLSSPRSVHPRPPLGKCDPARQWISAPGSLLKLADGLELHDVASEVGGEHIDVRVCVSLCVCLLGDLLRKGQPRTSAARRGCELDPTTCSRH
jgi:hypothetical protein